MRARQRKRKARRISSAGLAYRRDDGMSGWALRTLHRGCRRISGDDALRALPASRQHLRLL